MYLARCDLVSQVRSGMLPRRCLVAFTEDVPLCETRCVSVCFVAVKILKVLLLYQSTRITCFQVTSPKNACYVSFNTQTCYIVATLLINCIKCRERGKGEAVKRNV